MRLALAFPHDFPPWQTAYHYFGGWRLDGSWEKIHALPCQSEPVLRRVVEKPPARPS